jgi:glycosyltransferase involved in cell wall biosynthesis
MSQPRAVTFSAFAINLRAVAIVGQLRRLGFDVVRTRRHHGEGTTMELLTSLVPNCWRALTVRADLAIGFKPHPNVTLPLMICRWRGIPTWIDVDDLDHGYRRGLLARLAFRLQQPFPRRCDVVTYHHSQLRRYLVGRLRCESDRLVRIEQGVDVSLFAPITCTQPATTDASAAFVGHLNAANDVESVLEAWRIVTRSRPDARLLVVGTGPRSARLRRTARALGIERNVEFVPVGDHAEVVRHLTRARVGLLYVPATPFNEYRCSLKLREYFAAGLDVVCTDVGELAAFAPLTHQSSASIDSFATTILDVLECPDDERRLAARRYARDQLDWSILVEPAVAAIRARLAEAYPRRDWDVSAAPGVLVGA